MNDTLKVAGRIGAELGAAKAENEAMREALHWYAEKVAECRKIGSLGDNARQALDLDGGFRARDALPRQADHLRDATQMMVPSEIIRAIAWGGHAHRQGDSRVRGVVGQAASPRAVRGREGADAECVAGVAAGVGD